jgi:hypothetical protein
MTPNIQISPEEAQDLLTVLSKNEGAVKPSEAIHWTEDAAARIGSLRETIQKQTQEVEA